MSDFLLVGTLVGLVVGLVHAVYMSRLVACLDKTETPGLPNPAINFSLWTLGLWVLAGGTLFGLWIVSVAFYILFKAFR